MPKHAFFVSWYTFCVMEITKRRLKILIPVSANAVRPVIYALSTCVFNKLHPSDFFDDKFDWVIFK